jgi:hypothetical protein
MAGEEAVQEEEFVQRKKMTCGPHMLAREKGRSIPVRLGGDAGLRPNSGLGRK